MPFTQRRVRPFCGHVFAIVPPEPEREQDKLCPECAKPLAPPDRD